MKVKIWNIVLKVAGIWAVVVGIYNIATQYVPNPTCAGVNMICVGILFLAAQVTETKGGE